MSIIKEITATIEAGKAKDMENKVQEALDACP